MRAGHGLEMPKRSRDWGLALRIRGLGLVGIIMTHDKSIMSKRTYTKLLREFLASMMCKRDPVH